MSELSVFSDEHFMNQALKQAEYALEEGEVPVGAIVVSQNRIISKAYNQVERLKDATAHAEMLAITAAQDYLGAKYLQNCTLYVTLEPCTMCAGAIFWAQIEKVVFGASDESRGFERLEPSVMHPKTEIVKGLKSQESKALLQQFFNQIRRNN